MKAVVFVDVQKDFVKGGVLPFGYPAEDNVGKVIEFAKQCAADSNAKLYATLDTHNDDYTKTLEGKKLPVTHCIEGTDGWRLDERLEDALIGKATFVNKPTFGSYDLVGIFEEDFGKAGPDEITLVGYDLSICVLANAVLLRAKYPNVKIIVKTNLCGDVDEAAFNAAVKVLQMQQIDVEA